MDLKPTELRIGNLVYHKDNPLPQKVDGLDLYKIQSEYISEYSMPDYFKPIPITEEWLLNLGLRKHILSGKDDAVYYINHEGKTVLGYWLIDGAVNIGEFIPKNIKYVHELQNLYFVLTGVELSLSAGYCL